METITLHDKTFTLSMPEEQILNRIKEVAEQINHDYEGKEPLFLGILNGSFMFTSDLMKNINVPCYLSFAKVTSYVGTQSTGMVKELIGIGDEVNGRDIIIVEDIVESGHTMVKIIESLKAHNPASVKVCSLFFKPTKLVEDLAVDYVAFTIPDDFIVGFGLDYDGLGRNLRNIYTIAQ